MSMQWEVVASKSRKSKNPEKKLSQTERKKILENGPKLEEILPSHQVKNIMSNVNKDKNKVNKKPQADNKNVSSPKKTHKSAEPQKKVSAPQPSKPKNLELALQAVSVDDLQNLVNNLKTSFKDSQLVWLKQMSSYLNTRINYETDPCFVGKPIQYPSNIIPKGLKNVIMSTLNAVDEVNIACFYEQLLTGLVMDMSKNQPHTGYKVLLQLIGQAWPQVCARDLAKNAILRNSYQNRGSIGLTLLWALGQGGYVDLTTGLIVWQNLMTPVIDLKSYTRFVCEYIEKIFKISDNSAKINLTQDEFFSIYNFILSKTKNGLPKDCQKMLLESAFVLLKKYIQSCTKVSNLFLSLFKSIESMPDNDFELSGCVECLQRSDDCFKVWKMNYKKNSEASLLLLTKLSTDWDSYPSEFCNSKQMHEFRKEIVKINREMLNSKKKNRNLSELIQSVEQIQEKSTNKKKSTNKSSSCCLWTLGSLFLLGAIGATIIFDYNTHEGVFKKSVTGKFLGDIGALPYVETAWYKTMSNCARGYKWAENNTPIYYDKTKTITKPYIDLSSDIFKTVINSLVNLGESISEFVGKKSPAVIEFIEQYAPGLPKKIQDMSITAWSTSVNAYHSSCDFFKTKVFVGTLSPDNLWKAFNGTQITAAKYYSWFHEKVDTYAKIK